MDISTDFLQANLQRLRDKATANRTQADELLSEAHRADGAAQILEQLIAIKSIPAEYPPALPEVPPLGLPVASDSVDQPANADVTDSAEVI